MTVIEIAAFSIGVTVYLLFWVAMLVLPAYCHVERGWTAQRAILTEMGIVALFIFVSITIGNYFFAT